MKSSILVYYQNLFKNYEAVKWCSWAIMIIVNVGAFVLAMLVLFQCKPVGLLVH